MARKQFDYPIDVGGIIEGSYGTSVPLPAHQDYWECPICVPESPSPPPRPFPEYF